MRAGDIPLAIVTQNEHVQWLSGARFRDALSAAAMLTAEGRLTLFAPSKEPPFAVADEVVVFEAKSLSTIRNDQAAQYSAAVLEHLRADSPSRIGCEYSSFPQHLAASVDVELIDVEPQLFKLRRRKERDELHLLRRAIEATGAMYGRAREIVAPGVSELTVFNELQAVAVEVLGEPLTATGNDYACAARGGPPRDRRAEAGELYILDLGPAYRGYFADNCRTLAVGQEPTTLQQQAWEQCTRVFPLVESSVRPGASCRELFERAKAILDESLPWKFNHHLGHGIGLAPHEAPHPNPFWDEQFAEGDVVAIEPGLYHEELRAGIRLENDYLVTADGVELLSDFPLEL
ncbi:MAG: aminopeptidase P family protein [Planctomycetota bacterium]|nr:MAG: aminopeptidase P family protein [Planctomycetota bacterium]REK25771.1 MAG: aminopeptidase P family protein [Planctomycetota bacterium]REK46642.1 MAG: aminopeptidase P family protein [Planctomycetota bacterium]